MTIIDLSHEIASGDLGLSGETPQLINVKGINTDGYAMTRISMHSHTGTHIDAPSHMIAGAKSLTDFPLSKFQGRAMVVNCKQYIKQEIPLSYLKNFKDSLNDSEFIILNSGWYKKWNTPGYFDHYPVLSEEAALWLTNFKLKGIGLDMISIDPIQSQTVPIHKIMLSQEILIIENLNNLDAVASNSFIFQSFPIKYSGIDGSQVRAVAIKE